MTDETLFAAALESPDRAAYLAAACPDPPQRQRVERLLAAHDRASQFLRRPAVPRDAFETQAHDADDLDDALGFLSPATRPGALGRIGHYDVLDVLGRGGFGIVFRAFDDVLQRVVAVKVLAPSMAATSPARKRFLREARASAAIRHENVVQVHAVEEQPLPHIVMEFVPGESLQQRLDRAGPLDVPEVVRTGRQVAEGLAAAHATGVVHRDIKPANVLVEPGTGRVRITDFGLARAADDASLTRSGTVAGTPLYMAPEQANGESLDHRADLFSLGSVLYAVLTGHPPFRAETTLGVLKRVAADTPRPIREVIPEVPEWLCRVVEKLHAKDPADRFQTAREVADVLADCEAQLAAHKELRDFSRIPGGPPRRRFRRARPRLALACVAAVLLLTAAWHFGPGLVNYGRDRGELVIEPGEGLVSVIVLKNDEGVIDGNKLHPTVTDWLGMTQPQKLLLPPGTYQLNVGTFPMGTEVRQWEVTTSGVVGPSRQSWVLVDRTSAIITVERGQRVTLRPQMWKAPPPPPTPEERKQQELARLDGGWTLRGGKVGGVPLAAGDFGRTDLKFEGNEFRLLRATGAAATRRGTFEMDAPTHLRFTVRGAFGGPVVCAYRFDGDRLVLDFPTPPGAVVGSTGPFAPDHPTISAENLKTLGLALHNYANNLDALPPAAITKDGKPLLSWRVALLSYLEQDPLYRQFKLDEPWDSEHNLKLVPKMPAVYRSPTVATAEPGRTHYQVFTGRGTAFEPPAAGPNGRKLADFPDGLSNTILVAEGRDAVVWTKPDDLPFDPKTPLPKLGVYPAGPQVLMGDGSVGTLSPAAADAAVKAYVTRNGGENLDDDAFKRHPQFGPPLTLEFDRRAPAPGGDAAVQPLRDAVVALTGTRDVAQARFVAGVASRVEVLRAEAALTEARVALADAEGDAAAVAARLGELVKQIQEERDLIEQKVTAGVEGANALIEADVRLAAAHGRLAKAKLAPMRKP